VVTEIQRSAASALFGETKEAERLEEQLREAIEREQGSRRWMEEHQARADRLAGEVAEAEFKVQTAEQALTEIDEKRKLHNAELKQLGSELPAAADSEQQAKEAVERLAAELEGLRSAWQEAQTAIEQRKALVEERRLALEGAQKQLHREVGRQAAE
jgi:chromosome segregation ATPase